MSLQDLKTIASRAYTETDHAISLEAILEAGNTGPICGALTDTDAGYCAMRIRGALVGDLIMTMARLHDHPDRDRACLPRAFSLLRRSEVNEALIDAEGARLRLHYKSPPHEQIEEIHKSWRDFGRTNRTRLETLRDYRDAFLAHNLTFEPGDLPTFGQVFDLLSATRPIVSARVPSTLDRRVAGNDARAQSARAARSHCLG
jgi:AbiU2